MELFSFILVAVIGGMDTMLTGFIALMLIDYASGILCALWHKSSKTEGGGLSSRVGFKGILKKAAMLVCVIFGAQLDKVTGAGVCRTAILAMLAFNEGISIMENMASMGIKLPAIVQNALEKIGGNSNGSK